jgi:hypothetical protein
MVTDGEGEFGAWCRAGRRGQQLVEAGEISLAPVELRKPFEGHAKKIPDWYDPPIARELVVSLVLMYPRTGIPQLFTRDCGGDQQHG